LVPRSPCRRRLRVADAFIAFETAGWAEQAEAYHDFFATITTRAVDVLLDAGHVDQASRVLDIATGPGYLAAGSARRGASVVGIDIAHEMLQVARRLRPGIDFRRRHGGRLDLGRPGTLPVGWSLR
jgi:2-polyprenyl-3-methyl-5-hydroxy-6-metoxy-1,4-benzoquinol methylase